MGVGVSKDSKLDLNASGKEIPADADAATVADQNEQKNKKHTPKNIDTIIKRLTLPKGVILKNMGDDNKNNKMSFTDEIDKTRNDKSKFDINDLEQKDIDKIISHYKAQKKSKLRFLDRKLSMGDIEIMNKIDGYGLKKKFSLTNSRQLLLNNVFDDLKNEKFKLSEVPESLKVDVKKIDKENLNKILDYYKSSKEKKRYTFVKQSKMKQMRSDLRAKLNSR